MYAMRFNVQPVVSSHGFPDSVYAQGLLLPALDQFIVIDRNRLFFFVFDLQLRSEVTLGNGILVPVLDVMFLGELRSDVALYPRTFQTRENFFLFGAK